LKTADSRGLGTSCGSGLQCATGLCTSRNLQCAQQGTSLNITKSCGALTSTTCQLTCADPSNDSDCIVLESDFRDGINCGFAGHCLKGKCSHGKVLDQIQSWYEHNLSEWIILGNWMRLMNCDQR
jgi:hypothetical protein